MLRVIGFIVAASVICACAGHDVPLSSVVKKDGAKAFVYNPLLSGANGTQVSFDLHEHIHYVLLQSQSYRVRIAQHRPS